MHMKNDGTLDVSAEQRETIRKLEQRILDLEAKLVQRDVYEAEQRLPPEQAVLIKHLKTVEQCIDEGPVTYHYAEESDCSFCGEWQGHTRDCAWFALQMDRGVTSVVDDIHAVALQEHERRERQRMPREPANTPTIERMNQLLRDLWPPERQFGNLANDMRDAARYGLGNTRVEVNPLVPPGTVYVTNLSDFQGIPALRQDEPVAPPDDEDVP